MLGFMEIGSRWPKPVCVKSEHLPDKPLDTIPVNGVLQSLLGNRYGDSDRNGLKWTRGNVGDEWIIADQALGLEQAIEVPFQVQPGFPRKFENSRGHDLGWKTAR
jgi:hypothetical protein